MSAFVAGMAGGLVACVLTLAVVAGVIFFTLRQTLRRFVR
jgi:hypothetical protein